MALPDSQNTVTVRKLANTLNSYNNKVNTKLAGKADKVSNPTTGNLAGLDGNGNITDSLTKPSDFATSAQGAKADTAVQSVSINGGSNLKSGTSVDIPLAVATGTSGATAGAMSSDDKKKLNDIDTGAEVNQNAFSNVAANGTTIAASAKTDTLTIVGGTHTSVVGNSADKSVTINSTLSSETAAQSGTTVSLVTTGEKYTWNAKQDQIAFDGTYNATSNKAATVSSITSKIGELDVSNITANLGVGKTITALSETDGKIAATASDIQITESQVTNLTSDLALKAPLASPALTGTPTAPTAAQGTNTTQIATTEFVVAEIDAKIDELGDAMVYQGTLAGGSTGSYGALTPAANKGWTYKVTTAGKIDGVAVEVGDMLICNTDNTVAATESNYSTVVAKWDFIQTNLDGAVIGPSSAVTDASVAGFDGTTGKHIKQLTAAQVKAAAGLDLVQNQTITVTDTSVSDGTHTFNKYTHPTTTAVSAAAVKVGHDNLGHVVLGTALAASDVGLGNVVNTGDSDIPVENGTTKFTTGGAYTELAKKVDVVAGKGLSTNDFTNAYKDKLDGIAAGAEVNQNAFSNIKVGNVTVAADTKTDTVELIGSNHITITPDATNDTVTIATDIQDQTAYTSKGSATKVPQITTNSLGQVTGITEVTISGVTPASHSHGNIANGGTLTDTAAAAAGNDYVVIRDADNAKIQTSTIKGTDVADAVSKKHSHSTLTLSTTAQAYDGTHTLALPASDPYTSARTPSSHTHGNIQNGGTLQTTDVAIANGDKLVITDASNSDKVARSSTAFDGSTTTTALTPKGTFEAFAKAADITSAVDALDATKTSSDGTNVQVKVTEENGKITAVNITTDNTENKNNKVTSWSSTTTDVHYPSEKLVKDSLDGKAASSHAHGNITNAGTLTATGVALASGDSLVFVDSSDSSKINRTSITFDGSTATKALTQKGTWETFTNVTSSSTNGHINIDGTDTTVYTHPTSAGNKHIPSGGSAGQVLVYGGSSGTASWATLTDASMGQGYSATTSWSSAACTVTMENYELKTGGIVAIKFATAVPANATLNINGKGVKNIKYRGSNITADIIQNGDIAYFMYDGTNYTLLGTDRSVGEMTDTEVTDLLAALT